MALSTDLLSQFAKITKDEVKTKSDTTVYGTIVMHNGEKFVRIDGSDLLTPISSTTNVEDKERVTVMIKNHMATVTGNISSPAARTAEVETTSEAVKRIEADYVKTKDLEAEYAKIENLDATYANIDFTNIGTAAMEYFYANSGLIKDVVVGNQTITGELVGVTIRGDRIIGETVIADKLVIKGEDGLFYKLNTDGMNVEAEQTNENSLDGSVITAKSITATKISVEDLVAFDATIGGFKIEDTSIHSIAKTSVNNTTRGLYLGSDGQMALGDGTRFLKYYKDTDGTYKLAITADSFIFSSDGKSVADAINGIQVGGTQLLRRSQTLPVDTSLAAADRWRAGSSDRETRYEHEGGFAAISLIESGATENTWTQMWSPVSRLPTGWHGKQVTLSAWLMSPKWTDLDKGLWYYINLSQGGTSRLNYGSKSAIDSGGTLNNNATADGALEDGKWTRVSVTFTLNATDLPSGNGVFSDNTHAYVSFALPRNGELHFYAPKLELGNRATDWSPAPDDTDAEFEDVRAEIALTQDQITMEVNAVQVGGPNYLLNSDTPVSNSKYNIANYKFSDDFKPQAGKTYTIRIWGSIASDRTSLGVYNTNAYIRLGGVSDNEDGTYSCTFTWKNDAVGYPEYSVESPRQIQLYQAPRTGTSTSTITRIKLEAGNKATDWTRHPEEFQAGTNVLINKDQFTVTTPEFNVNITSEDGTERMLNINKDSVYAQRLDSPNVMPRYDGPDTLYVNPNTSTADGVTYFRSLSDAVSKLNCRYLDKSVTINLTGTVGQSETVTILGITGAYWVTITGTSSAHAKLIGHIRLHYNSAPIKIQYLDIDTISSKLMGIELAGRAQYAVISNCVITGRGDVTGAYGVNSIYGAMAKVSNCELYDLRRSVRSADGGLLAASNCKGNCSPGTNLANMHLSGTQACSDALTWTDHPNGGEIYKSSVTINQGSKPTPEPEATSVSYTANSYDTWASGGWNVYSNNDDIYQGYTSALGEHRGCFWFDNTTLRSDLKIKTIKQATLSLYQISGVGRNQSVQVSLEGITVSYGGSQPFGATEHEYGVIGTTLGVNQTTTFTIPTKAITHLVNGDINGFMLRTGETSVMTGDDNSYNYARFVGKSNSSYRPKLTITYA